MTWYYASGNERQGPVDDATLDRLIATGVVTQDTLVWKAGMADWQPLAQARPRAAAPLAPVIPPPPAVTPAPQPTQPRVPAAGTYTPGPTGASAPGAGGAGAYGGSFGAGAGAGAGAGGWTAPGPSGINDPDQLLARIVTEGRSVNIGEIVGRAWQLVMDNVGVAVGGAAMLIIAGVLSAVPCLGVIIGFFVSPVLAAGIYLLLLKLNRRQPAEFGDAFSAFSIAYLPLLLQTVVQAVLTMVAVAPGYVLIFVGNAFAERSEGLSLLVTLVGALLILPAAIYLGVSWVFSPILIVDKGLEFWPAMELSRKAVAGRFFSVFGLLFLCGLITLAGVLALCVGIFFALPMALGAIAIAYDDLFGDR